LPGITCNRRLKGIKWLRPDRNKAGAAQNTEREPVKVGMITTLSGGGAGLGIDARDGFMLAIKQAGNKDVEVVIEDDQRKPDVAVQLADKMIQSDKVDILTGIIWSNLAMAVVPARSIRANSISP
jgi:branched-chain amino acid transport system substrate-binding protein